MAKWQVRDMRSNEMLSFDEDDLREACVELRFQRRLQDFVGSKLQGPYHCRFDCAVSAKTVPGNSSPALMVILDVYLRPKDGENRHCSANFAVMPGKPVVSTNMINEWFKAAMHGMAEKLMAGA